ncbi:MAG: GNAT family N-acetyltransferase [Bacteroidales bacterium]|nr:GNAT family N-acetyltransferase [Bacteroidales bacterium]
MYEVRNYKSNDWEEVDALWQLTGMGGKERGDTAQTVERCNAAGGALFVMLDKSLQKEKIIGTLWLTNDGRRLYIHHCGLLPEYRGKGLSHKLLAPALKFAKEKNIQIKLEVHLDNTPARKLYAKYGFISFTDYDIRVIRDVKNLPF